MEADTALFDVLKGLNGEPSERNGFVYRSASDMLAMVADGKGNANVSPISLWLALALVAQGAQGRTLKQLEEALGTEGLSAGQYRMLIESINQRRTGAKTVMAIYESMWLSDTLAPRASFIDAVHHAFAAEVNSIDFSGPNAGKTISSWISKHTKGLLHPALECDGTELLSIISTVFADSRWKTPFELNDTEPAVFHGDRGDTTVPFMRQRCKDVSYLCDETFGWERVDIPFDDDSELRIVLPDPETLEILVHDPTALRRAFSTELTETLPQEDKRELTGMDRLKAKLAARKNPTSMPIYANTVTAKVALPRFEIDSTINARTLVSILQSLGITDAFDPTHADFSGICEEALAISGIMQGTHIEVNEHGARAAVYTGIAVAGAVPQWGPEITFTVDRPFMYALMTRDRLPLFVGAVRNL